MCEVVAELRIRLSGFLPIQSAYYSGINVIDDFRPEFKPCHIYDALKWYEGQDVTLEG